MDNHANFATSLIATAPSPAISGTSLTITSGTGARFPAGTFNAVVGPAGATPEELAADHEIIRVTTRVTDGFTVIVRAQEGTSARAIAVGDQIFLSATAKVFTDIEAAISAASFSVGDSLALTGSVLDTIQDIRPTATPTFAGIDLTPGADIGSRVQAVSSNPHEYLLLTQKGDKPVLVLQDGVTLHPNVATLVEGTVFSSIAANDFIAEMVMLGCSDGYYGGMVAASANGSPDAPEELTDGQIAGGYSAYYYAAGNFNIASFIYTKAEGMDGTDSPGSIYCSTTAPGDLNVTEQLRIGWYSGLGTAAEGGYRLWIPEITTFTNDYAFWYDSPGVYRIKGDGVMAYYNPTFTKYTPGATNFERVVQQWNSNVLEYGAEAGGTGVLRSMRLLGASVLLASDDAYGAGWNGSLAIPTKNAIYDKIESLAIGGVSSITGTANQVIASSGTGAVTLSLPQSIHTGANPTFAGAILSAQLAITSTTEQLRLKYDTSNYCAMTVGSAGFTTLSPTGADALLFVSANPGTTGAAVMAVSDQTNGTFRFSFPSAGVCLWSCNNDQHLTFGSRQSATGSVVERMRISMATGCVGIGTAGPSYALHIAPTSGVTAAQTVFIQDATASTGKTKVIIKAGAGDAANSDHLLSILNNAGTEVAYFRPDGLLSGIYMVTADNVALGISQSASSGVNVGVNLANAGFIAWAQSNSWFATKDAALARNAAGVLEVNNGTAGTFRDLKLRNVIGQTGYTEMTEMTAPSAGATNNLRLYAEDSGGKTRLMCLFPTGAAVQIAIEP